MHYDTQWIRVAGNARAIKEGSNISWRCYLENGELVELSFFAQLGPVTATNCFFRTVLDHPDIANGLSAWIDMYGSLTVTNESGVLEMETPA